MHNFIYSGHCKHLAPEYVKAAAQLKSAGVILAKHDCEKYPAVPKQYGIHAFPTLYLYV
jgi:protein disulfide-isomerase A1